MSLDLENKSNTGKSIEKLQNSIDKSTRSLVSAVRSMNIGYETLWGTNSDQEVADILNELGPVKAQEMFSKNTIHGSGLNSILDDLNVDGPRVNLTTPRDVTFADGLFSVASIKPSGEIPPSGGI